MQPASPHCTSLSQCESNCASSCHLPLRGVMLRCRAVSTEAHLTLSHSMCADSALEAWLAPRGLAFTRIELSHGVSPQQPMITMWAASREDALRDVAVLR